MLQPSRQLFLQAGFLTPSLQPGAGSLSLKAGAAGRAASLPPLPLVCSALCLSAGSPQVLRVSYGRFTALGVRELPKQLQVWAWPYTNPKCKRGPFAKSALMQSAKRGDGMQCETGRWGGRGSPPNPSLGAAVVRPATLLVRLLDLPQVPSWSLRVNQNGWYRAVMRQYPARGLVMLSKGSSSFPICAPPAC